MKMIDRDEVTAGVNPFRDIWDYMRQDRPHRWPALGLAITIPLVILWFIADSFSSIDEPRRTIIYVENWRSDRSEFEIRRDWLLRARAANEANQQRRNAAGALAEAIGQDFDQARADREFAEAYAQIDKALADLDHAERNGLPLPSLPRAAEPATPATPAATPAAKR